MNVHRSGFASMNVNERFPAQNRFKEKRIKSAVGAGAV